MKKKVQAGLKLMQELVVVWFVLDSAGTCIRYWTQPERWVANSAPWYTGILVHGAVALPIAAMLSLTLWLMQRAEKAGDSKADDADSDGRERGTR